MTDRSQSLLQYFRSSLADGDRMEIRYSKVQELGQLVSSLAPVPRVNTDFLFRDVVKSQTMLPVLLAPLRLTQRAQDGWRRATDAVVPFWVPAELDREGTVWPPAEPGTKPWFVRGVLEPNDHLPRDYPCLASVDEVDKKLSWAEFPNASWADYWSSAQAYFWELVGTGFDGVDLEELECKSRQIVVFPAKASGMAGPILGLYDHFLKVGVGLWSGPLNALLKSRVSASTAVGEPEEATLESTHHGQMAATFALSPSQRIAVALLNKTSSDGVLAVNGPPGTGKTTLLQTVVADLVVKCYLERNRPPVILGSSVNNKAITNIIDSFARVVPADEHRTGLNERWLPELDALGHYLASGDPDNAQKAKASSYWITSRGLGLDSYVEYCAGHSRSQCEEHFRGKFRAHFAGSLATNLEQAQDEIRQSVQKRMAGIDQSLRHIRDLKQLCLDFGISSEVLSEIRNATLAVMADHRRRRELWDTIIAKEQLLPTRPWFLVRWIASIRHGHESIRGARLQAAIADSGDAGLSVPSGNFSEMSSQVWAQRDASFRAESNLRTRWQDLSAGWERLCVLVEDYLIAEHDIAPWPEMVQSQLDLTARHECFWYALHGIEALWLLKRDDSTFVARNQDQRVTEERWRQVAYLTPVFISTFHSLPVYFSYPRTTPRGDREYLPLVGYADLLVVDEAGQVSPELGVAAFGLAQKALVVGDLKQLEPIWSIASESIDFSNAKRSVLVSTREEYDAFRDAHVGSLNGSLMRLAQDASEFRFPANSPEPGSLLTEHRRCQPAIIEYCNRFVYNRLLQVKTKPSPDSPWPRLGYCHLPGESVKKGGSLTNELEAKAIAVWVQQNEIAIRAHGTLAERIAIVTPFRAQKYLILSALNDLGVSTKDLVVGTVHALQGAEKAIVLFSPVYGRNVRSGPLFFNLSPSMLNVAVSRAQEHFLVFGTMTHFQDPTAKTPAANLGQLLFEATENEISNEFYYSETALPVFGADPVDRISTLDQHRRALRKAFETAKERVILVSPFIAQAALDADEVPCLIRDAVQRGVAVLVFTDDALDRHQGVVRPGAVAGRKSLIEAGAELTILAGIHNKSLVIDKRVVIEGSFNWLSAVRDPSSPFSRRETSIVLNPPYSQPFIERLEAELEMKPQGVSSASVKS